MRRWLRSCRRCPSSGFCLSSHQSAAWKVLHKSCPASDLHLGGRLESEWFRLRWTDCARLSAAMSSVLRQALSLPSRGRGPRGRIRGASRLYKAQKRAMRLLQAISHALDGHESRGRRRKTGRPVQRLVQIEGEPLGRCFDVEQLKGLKNRLVSAALCRDRTPQCE